jgi:pimeloyl-ACP methyl ester carboxylesterase
MPRSHLAVHFLGGDGPTALYAHATGFHAHCWSPIAAALPGLHNVGYDARGHGDTPIGTDWPVPDAVDWNVYGDDAAVVARSLSVDGQVLGVGHSMGGAALLMAAIASPELFCGLVRKRRSAFASYEAAFANYAAKPPMNVFTPASLEAYVRFGFAEGDDGQVHLKCTPEHEARTYEAGGNHITWAHLGEVTVPVWVLCGHPENGQPSAGTAGLADQIPGARYIELDHLGHFGPMQSPDEIAALVGEASVRRSVQSVMADHLPVAHQIDKPTTTPTTPTAAPMKD